MTFGRHPKKAARVKAILLSQSLLRACLSILPSPLFPLPARLTEPKDHGRSLAPAAPSAHQLRRRQRDASTSKQTLNEVKVLENVRDCTIVIQMKHAGERIYT